MKRVYGILTVLVAFTLLSCAVEEHSFNSKATAPGHNITFSDIENITSDAVKIKILVWDNETGYESELASAAIENGSADIELPANVEDKFLYRFRDEAPSSVRLSDNDLMYTFISFLVFNPNDRLIGRLYFENETIATDLIYSDRACLVTGIHAKKYMYKEYQEVYNLNLSRGYHWTQYDLESETEERWTNGTPIGAKWVYASM